MCRSPPDHGEHGLRTTLVRLGAYLAALIFYAAALDALGFIVSTVLVVVFILRIAEGYGWRTDAGDRCRHGRGLSRCCSSIGSVRSCPPAFSGTG